MPRPAEPVATIVAPVLDPPAPPLVPFHQLASALAFGAVIVLLPLALLLVAIPIVALFEVARAVRIGSVPIACARAAAIATIFVAALAAPTKDLDRMRVTSLPTATPMTLDQLNHRFAEFGGRGFIVARGADAQLPVRFSAESMSGRRFYREIEEQTHRHVDIGYCGNSATVLFGGSMMGAPYLGALLE